MKNLLVALAAILVLSTTGASWTAVWLLHRASEARAEQAEQAEERAAKASERAERVEQVTLAGVVCILGQIAGRGGIDRPSESKIEDACRIFLEGDENGG